MVRDVGLSSCDLQVMGLIPVATRSRDPPYHLGFGESDMIIRMAVTNEFTNTRGYWRTLAEELTSPKRPRLVMP